MTTCTGVLRCSALSTSSVHVRNGIKTARLYSCSTRCTVSARRAKRGRLRNTRLHAPVPVFELSDQDTLLLTVNQASLQSCREYRAALLGFHLANKTAPQHLLVESFPTQPSTYSLPVRRSSFFQLPKPNTSYFQSSPIYFAAHILNSLPAHSQTLVRIQEESEAAPPSPNLSLLTSYSLAYLLITTLYILLFNFNFTSTLPYSAHIIIM